MKIGFLAIPYFQMGICTWPYLEYVYLQDNPLFFGDFYNFSYLQGRKLKGKLVIQLTVLKGVDWISEPPALFQKGNYYQLNTNDLAQTQSIPIILLQHLKSSGPSNNRITKIKQTHQYYDQCPQFQQEYLYQRGDKEMHFKLSIRGILMENFFKQISTNNIIQIILPKCALKWFGILQIIKCQWPQLKKLDLSGNYIGGMRAIQLCNVERSKWPNLQYLDIGKLDSDPYNLMFSLLKKERKLRTIRLNNFSFFVDFQDYQLSVQQKYNQKSKGLLQFQKDSLQFILQKERPMFLNYKVIDVLETIEDYEVSASLITQQPNLCEQSKNYDDRKKRIIQFILNDVQYLDLSLCKCNIFQQLNNAPSWYQSLVALNLKDTCFGKFLFLGLRGPWKALKYLNISGTQLKDEDMHSLSLKSMKQIKQIHLDRNKITFIGWITKKEYPQLQAVCIDCQRLAKSSKRKIKFEFKSNILTNTLKWRY